MKKLLALVLFVFCLNASATKAPYSKEVDDRFTTLETAPSFTGNVAVAGTLAVTGASTLTGDVTIAGDVDSGGAFGLGAAATFTDSDATPDVSGGSHFETNTSSVTITDFDGADIYEGQIIVVVSKGAITYDVTSSGIKGGTTDIITAAGDVTTFLYDGADWLVVARMDMSDDLN